MNNAIVDIAAGVPSAAAERPVHFWEIPGFASGSDAVAHTGNLRCAAAHLAPARARAHRDAIPVRHRKPS